MAAKKTSRRPSRSRAAIRARERRRAAKMKSGTGGRSTKMTSAHKALKSGKKRRTVRTDPA